MSSQSPFKTFIPLQRFRRGERASASKLNDGVQAINELLSRHRLPMQPRKRKGGGVGGGSTVKSIEVRIAKAIAIQADATDPEEETAWDEMFDLFGDGSHIRCAPVNADGTIGQQYLVVHPMRHLSVADFQNTDGTQIWSGADPDDTSFWALTGPKGLTIQIFGGQQPVVPPLAGELCA